MQRSNDRFLTTHMGSLVRPPAFREMLRAKENKQGYDEADFEACLRTAVSEVVQKQAEIGIDVIDDGEYGKSLNWARYILERITGFEHRREAVPIGWLHPSQDRERFPEFYAEYDREHYAGRSQAGGQWVCTGPITYQGHALLQRDIDNFKAGLGTVNVAEAFMPVAAPASIGGDAANEYYATEEEFVYAVAEAAREEYRAITDAGLLVQIDDAYFATSYDRIAPYEGMERYRRWAELRVEALNHALRGIPEERIRYHLCWGSWPGPHTTDVPLEVIVDLILRVRAGAYCLEQSNARHEPRGASRPGRGAHHPPRTRHRTGEPHRGHRLRLLSESPHGQGARVHHVGQAGSSGGGGATGLRGDVGRVARGPRTAHLTRERPSANPPR